MRIIKTHELTEARLASLSQTDTLWVYNGLDCCVTEEVLGVLLAEIDDVALNTYNFSSSLMGPVMEMNMRGLRVDVTRRDQVVKDFSADVERMTENLQRIIRDGVGMPDKFNPASPQQVGNLLYDVLKLPEVKKRNQKGIYVRTSDEDALNKCGDKYVIARPIVAHILAIRMLSKRVSTLITDTDEDGRMRTNFNIGGTNTGRLSSSLGDFGAGGNLQNWEDKLRSIFIPDEGMEFGNIDLAQADARNVGAICWNLFVESHGEEWAGRYLNACESGDLHVAVCKMCWPGLGWTGDVKRDRAIAEQKFYRHLSYRDSSKKLGHGTNYRLTPRSAQTKTQIPAAVVEGFQGVYFKAFPAIPEWHTSTINELLVYGHLTTPFFGRRRYFMGRRSDDDTQREAIAYKPQSMTADEIDTAMLKLWRTRRTQILLQLHDALFFQYPREQRDEVMPIALEACRTRIPLARGREFIVPPDAQIGMNWGKRKEKKDGTVENPNGLDNWRG